MNNFFIRLSAGLIYISVITFSILYDQTSFIIVSSILFFLSIYESNILWLKIPKKEGFNIYPIAQLSIFISYFLFISIPYGGWIYNEFYNPFSILFIFILIWITDTMSYVIGVLFGKNKIDKKISANKTWEGFFGGFLFSILFSIISFNYIQEVYPLWKTISLSVIIPIFSLIGDMAQSKLKRKAGVKNSGFLLPGHGGIYDRLDSTIGVAPIAFLITIV